MALAILELLAFERANVRFNIDTGSNRYYQLKIGRGVQRRSGVDWIDDVFFVTPMATNDAGGGLLNSSKDISVPATRFEPGHSYAQLFTFKSTHGKSPAFSRVLKVPVGSGYMGGPPIDYEPSLSMSNAMNTTDQFNPSRAVPCRTYREAYSQPASLEDLLAGIVRVAGPVVLNLLGGAQGGGQPGAAAGAATGAAGGAASGAGSGGTGQLDILTTLLRSILGSLPGAAGGAVSRPQSLLNPVVHHNRFASTQSVGYSQPFIFGIDDVLLGSLIGPFVQILPQLMNSANQQRVQMKQADNKMITDLMSDVNRRMLMQQLLQARQPAAAGQPDNSADMNQLLQLLQQAAPAEAAGAPAPNPAPAAAPAPVARTSSLSAEVNDGSVLSSKAMVAFETADAIAWNGAPKILFARNQPLQIKLQLKIAEPAPKTALPKAIVKIIFQDASDKSVSFEKIFKQKDILANTVMQFAFQSDELSHIPANKVISVLAEMRWRTKGGRQYKALGSTEIVLVNKYFLKEQGKDVSAEQELTDMKQFRPFWNNVWQAPSLDAATGSRASEKKYLWELDVNAKYSVLLSADHEANGLMQTKILRGKPDAESMTEKIDGRMKAGIELSIAELNKLLPLWNGEAALEREKLEALQTAEFAKNNAGEFTYNLKLKGRAAQRGLVWVVPVFKLFECTLSTVTRTDDAGQVAAMGEEKVRFPLPVSARVIGLKANQ
jgi:hypothetical protein